MIHQPNDGQDPMSIAPDLVGTDVGPGAVGIITKEGIRVDEPKGRLVRVSSSIVDLTGKSASVVAKAAGEIPKGVLVKVDIDRISPAMMNGQIYRPIGPDDPDTRSLADDIRARGLLDPIVITRDLVILSGHRRHAACRLAGLKEVICRFEDISSGERKFLPLLVAYNNQRVKSIDEVLREQVIASADPKRAHEALRNHRAVQSYVEAEFLDIGERRVRSKISQGKMEMLHAIIDIVNGLRKYWPISERRVHYGLLNDPPLRHTKKPDSRYQNNPQCYKDTTDMVTRGRLEGHIPFSAIGDPTRDRLQLERAQADRDLHQAGAGGLPAGLLAGPDAVPAQPHRDHRREEHDRVLDQACGGEVHDPLHVGSRVLQPRPDLSDGAAVQGQRQEQADPPGNERLRPRGRGHPLRLSQDAP
jgi:hypothetical protein